MTETESVGSKKLLRVGIYLRLSDEDKDKENEEDDSESIKNQRNLLLDEIAKNVDFVLVDEYCDEDLSGAGTYRPEFERLIKDCELGRLDIVLCKSQSRFSRDMEIIEKYLHKAASIFHSLGLPVFYFINFFDFHQPKMQILVNNWRY